MPRAKVTSKGQVTIPVAVRKALGMKQGDMLAFEARADYVVVRRVPTALEVSRELEAQGGLLSLPEGMTDDEAVAAYFDDWVDNSGTIAYVVGGKHRTKE